MTQQNAMTCLLWFLVGLSSPSLAQETIGKPAVQIDDEKRKSDSKSSTQSQLTEGLLDLLKEPAGEASKQTGRMPEITPADVGLDGEDLGEQSADPLQSVRQSMLIAAGYLERGQTSVETQTLQSDIVSRLDDFIQQLEDTNSDQDQPPEPDESQAESETQPSNQTQFSTAQKQKESSDDDREPGGDERQQQGGTAPGDRGTMAKSRVDLADPRALQQSVWGQLPDRVRKQMQSSMVERFLPSYRAEIEAYFQALMKKY